MENKEKSNKWWFNHYISVVEKLQNKKKTEILMKIAMASLDEYAIKKHIRSNEIVNTFMSEDTNYKKVFLQCYYNIALYDYYSKNSHYADIFKEVIHDKQYYQELEYMFKTGDIPTKLPFSEYLISEYFDENEYKKMIEKYDLYNNM